MTLSIARALALFSGVSLAACSDAVDQRAEEPALSVAATTISWDPKSEMKQIASTKGCDSWTPTWAPDGNLYTGYGDCGTTRPGGTSSSACGTTGWGAGERADIATKYLSSDGKTFFLFSSGGDCLSIARGVLQTP